MLIALASVNTPLPEHVLHANKTATKAIVTPDPFERELSPFPPKEVVTAWREFQKERIVYLETRLDHEKNTFDDWRLYELREALWDVRNRYSIWDELDTAQCTNLDYSMRKESLGRLKDVIGKEAYLIGRMPDPVDLFYFSRTD